MKHNDVLIISPLRTRDRDRLVRKVHATKAELEDSGKQVAALTVTAEGANGSFSDNAIEQIRRVEETLIRSRATHSVHFVRPGSKELEELVRLATQFCMWDPVRKRAVDYRSSN